MKKEKPYEKFKNVKDHICKLAGDYKCWDNRLTADEALELCQILEQEPCEDCVSRKRIKQIIGNIIAEYDTETIHIDRLIDEIDDLPPVTPTSSKMEQVEWIPVKDRMPEEQIEVLVTREFPDGRGGTKRVLEIASFGAERWSNSKCWITNDFRRYPTEEIVAWMPLPQPYKAESEVRNE